MSRVGNPKSSRIELENLNPGDCGVRSRGCTLMDGPQICYCSLALSCVHISEEMIEKHETSVVFG